MSIQERYKAIADVMNIPVNYDVQNRQVQIGGKATETPDAGAGLTKVLYASPTGGDRQSFRQV